MKYCKSIFVLGLMSVLALTSCKQQTKNESKNTTEVSGENVSKQAVKYTIGRRYFIKNNVEGKVPNKLTTQKDFEHYFGAAAVMGDDGIPTKIDFAKQFVIVVDYQTTEQAVGITPESLFKENGKLVLMYNVEKGDNLGYSTRPFLMLIVSKTDEAPVVLKQS